jgi:triosephosphate isomerase (TIM)
MARRPLVAGNWKMNGLRGSIGELEKIVAGARGLRNTDIMVCPPATLIESFATAARGSAVMIGGQDCHALAEGAYTGEISAEMLRDAGARAVIVGHSERRQYHCETDEAVRAKVQAALRADLLAILCVGETGAERDSGRTHEVVDRQLDGSLPDGTKNVVIAYEPVWAIGTGRVASAGDAQEVCSAIRAELGKLASLQIAEAVRVLYGGSVNAKNVGEIVAQGDVDGALVGGASLDGEQFATLSAIAAGGPLP